MTTHPHLEESLQRDIDRIRSHITTMALLAEEALRDCVKSFVEHDRKLAYQVILRDQYIDEKEKEIDRLCLEFLVRQQPIAQHLRFAYGAIRTNLELERVGDYAESIARQLLRLKEAPADGFRDRIVELAELAIGMFHESVAAFVKQDPSLAEKNIGVEEAADVLRSQLIGLLVDLFRENQIAFGTLDPLLGIIRRYERVADQARNICLEALYMCTGEYSKHPGAEAFRVLFVDDHNSCCSQMAEAIAGELGADRFVFSSAGVDPRPIDPLTVEFMKTKGYDVSRMVPRAIHRIPNLDHYQVVVVFSEEARKAFPERPRKMVVLDWVLDDPSSTAGSPEQTTAAYEAAYQFIQNQLRDLVGGITGAYPSPERSHE